MRTQKYMLVFGMDGKLVKKIPNKDYKYDSKYTLESGTIVKQHYLQTKGKDSTYYEFATYKNGNDTLKYFPFSTKRYQDDIFINVGDQFNTGTNRNEMLFHNAYSFDLFKITPNKVSLKYHIILPAVNSLPPDFMTNPIYKKEKRTDFFQKNPKVLYGLRDTYLIGDFLYLKMNCWGWEKDIKKAIIYNLKNSEITSLEDIEPDEKSYFLPINDSGYGYDFTNQGFLKFEGNNFYTAYSSLAMFTFKEQSAGKKAKYPPLLQNYFKTQSRKSNPVLIMLKPKTN